MVNQDHHDRCAVSLPRNTPGPFLARRVNASSAFDGKRNDFEEHDIGNRTTARHIGRMAAEANR